MSDADELHALAADLTKASTRAKERAPLVVRKAALDVVAHGKRFSPVDTGATKGSIGADITTEGGEVVAVIGPTTHYAPYLEYGTSRAAPRPFMGPALDIVAPAFTEAIAQLGGEIR